MSIRSVSIIIGALISFTALSQNNVCFIQPNFQTPNLLTHLRSLTINDFNNDGFPDIIGGKPMFQLSPPIMVCLSNGIGGFSPTYTLNFGSNTSYFESADLDNDGNCDLIISNSDSSNVLIAKGNGNGTFSVFFKLPVGNTPASINITDLNNDGLKDILVICQGSNEVSVIINMGNLNFFQSVNYPIGFTPFSIETADIDGDNFSDVIVIDSDNIKLFKGLGNGNLVNSGTLTIQSNCMFSDVDNKPVAIKDIDNDGKVDIISAFSNSITILKGNGNFTFNFLNSFSITSTQNNPLVSIVIEDLNGDQNPDLAIAIIDLTVQIFLNNGNGSFINASSFIVPGVFGLNYTYRIFSFDNDLNGKKDLAFFKNNSGEVDMLINCNQTYLPDKIFERCNSRITPNPTTGIFKIETKTEIENIEIFDTNGKIIFNSNFKENFDLSNYKDGIYFLRVKTLKEEIENIKLIKTN